jgi:hypothetical protein
VKVLRLLEYRCRDTVAILRVLLAMAIEGRLRGLIVCYRTADGEERTVFTGAYKAHPQRALGAILSSSVEMARASGEMD